MWDRKRLSFQVKLRRKLLQLLIKKENLNRFNIVCIQNVFITILNIHKFLLPVLFNLHSFAYTSILLSMKFLQFL